MKPEPRPAIRWNAEGVSWVGIGNVEGLLGEGDGREMASGIAVQVTREVDVGHGACETWSCQAFMLDVFVLW